MKQEIWTIVESLNGEVLPWASYSKSEAEAKLAVAKNMGEIFDWDFAGIEWSDFESNEGEETGWIRGDVLDDPNHTFYLTRVL